MNPRDLSTPPDGRTRLLGIVGAPLEHSRSPELHTAVLRELGRNMLYVPVPVPAARLRSFLGLAQDLGFVGLNVTTPFKERAFACVEPLDDETRRTRMINTVLIAPASSPREGSSPREASSPSETSLPREASPPSETPWPRGTGTDGAGVVRWLRSIGAAEGPIGVLGFGPTARSVVHRAWAETLPVTVVLTRRPRSVRATLSKWRSSGQELPKAAPSVLGWDAITSGASAAIRDRRRPASGSSESDRSVSGRIVPGRSATARPVPGRAAAESPDRILTSSAKEQVRAVRTWISVLPVGVSIPDHFWERIDPGAVVLDMNYGEGRDHQCAAARSRGHRASDGLGPLLEQAALSLSFWLGEDVPVELFHRAAKTSAARLRPR